MQCESGEGGRERKTAQRGEARVHGELQRELRACTRAGGGGVGEARKERRRGELEGDTHLISVGFQTMFFVPPAPHSMSKLYFL